MHLKGKRKSTMVIDNDNNLLTSAFELRRCAEEQLKAEEPPTVASGTDDARQRLIHELQVHRIELELQNAELRQARNDVETTLEKYTDLYDFAPVGYFTLDKNGEITAVNLCGAGYLGIERATLLERRFMQFVAAEYRPAFAAFLDTVFSSQGKQTCEVVLLGKGIHPLSMQIEAVAYSSGQGCRLALMDITARKEAEEQLYASEQQFRTLAQNAPDNISRYDCQGRRVYINPHLERTLQRTLAELIGKRPSQTNPDGEFDALEKVILDVAATGEDASFEQLLPGEDGVRTHLVHLTAEREAGGKISGVLAIGRDITAQRRVEEKLIASECDFRTLAENSPNVIVRYDRQCRRVYVNPAYVLETECTFDHAVGELTETNWCPDMLAEVFKAKLRQVMETGVADEMLLEWTGQNGQLICHAIQVVAERDPAGKVTGCLAIGHNVTLLKEAELRLARLTENSPGAMYSYLLRPDGTACMPYVSTNIMELVGLSPEELAIDMAEVSARIHPADAARWQKSINESARTLSPWHAEFRIRHPEKGDIWLEGRSLPERQPDGGILWYGFLHEITERKRIAESLRAKQEQLTTMAVELSLTADRERRRIAAELHDQIGQTLLLSRIKLGTLADVFFPGSNEKTYEEIKSLLDQTIRDIRSLTQQLNPPVLTSVGLEAALEWLAKRMEADYSLVVDFAADRNEKQLTEELSSVVYQSVRELLINVVKHSGTGKARLSISRDGDMLALAVEDQGVGFSCLPGTDTNRLHDCSFGLFNIRQRIKLLGGAVMIESTPGSGTRATIRVPVAAGVSLNVSAKKREGII